MNLIANFAVLASRRTIFDLPVCDLGWDDALVFINELASIPVGQTEARGPLFHEPSSVR